MKYCKGSRPDAKCWGHSPQRLLFVFALTAASMLGKAQTLPGALPLWQSGAPGSPTVQTEETVRVTPEGDHVVSHVSQPSITPFLPKRDAATGAAVVVIPGGGHREIWMDHEGYNVARWLQAHGVAAFVLKYRLAREPGSTYTIGGTELGDAQRAIRLVRSRASEWNIDPQRIGVMGFSAGGELAALVSTHGDNGLAGAGDAIDRQSSRVAFQALIYPALPKDLPLSAKTPVAFLACGEKDRSDIARELPRLYLALREAGVSTELHIFAGVGHGFGLRASNPPGVAAWPQLFLDWLRAEGQLASAASTARSSRTPTAGAAPRSEQLARSGVPGKQMYGLRFGPRLRKLVF